MANFTDVGIAPINASVTPSPGFAPQTGGGVDVGSAVVQGLGVLGGLFDNFMKDRANEANQAAVTEFTQSQLALADAVEQGVLTSAQARSRMRANYLRSTTSSPSLAGDFAKIQKDIVSTAGLGKVVAEGTEEEKLYNSIRAEAVNSGWVPLSVTGTDNERQAVEDYLNFKRQGEELARSTAIINEKKARVQLDSSLTANQAAKLDLSIKVEERKAQTALINMGGTYFNNLNQKLSDIEASFRAGNTTADEAIRLLNNEWAIVQQATAGAGALAGGGTLNAVITPMETLKNQYTDYFKGNTSKEILNNKVDSLIGMKELMMASDPETANFIAVSRLIPNADLVTLPGVSNLVAKLLTDAENPEGPIPNPIPANDQQKPEVKEGLNILSSNMRGVLNGEFGEDQTQIDTVNTALVRMMEGVDVYRSAVDNPTKLNDIVAFVAGPTFGEFSEAQKGIPREVGQKLNDVIKTQYEDVLVPLLAEEYQKAQTFVAKTPMTASAASIAAFSPENFRPVSERIVPIFEGGGVKFGLASGVWKDIPTGVSNKIESLNRTVAPKLNELIRFNAHVNGTRDYKASWEDMYARQFGMVEEQNSTPANITNPKNINDLRKRLANGG
jgi:hypothetical protein